MVIVEESGCSSAILSDHVRIQIVLQAQGRRLIRLPSFVWQIYPLAFLFLYQPNASTRKHLVITSDVSNVHQLLMFLRQVLELT